MSTLYGYIRTSRRLIADAPGSDPETQRRQLLAAGVAAENVYQDLGVSGATGTNTRKGWRALNSRLGTGDVLVVVSVDRVGRGWIDLMSVIRDLQERDVRLRSLAASEEAWTGYLDADPNTPEAMIGTVLATVFAWAAQQELEQISRRTKAGLERARAQGVTLGRPRVMTEEDVDAARRLLRDGMSKLKVAKALKVGRATLDRYLESC